MALTSTEEAQTRALIAQNAALLSLANSEPTIISKLAATKVSLADLTAATSLNDTDLFLVRQGTTEKSVAKSILATTVPDASETVKGIVEIATQAEINAGTAGNFAVTPAKLRFGFGISLTTNGYITFPTWMGGLIIQWGTTASFSGTPLAVTFPIPFPTTCLSISAINYLGSTNTTPTQDAISIYGLTTSIFNIRTFTGVVPSAKYIAIGN